MTHRFGIERAGAACFKLGMSPEGIYSFNSESLKGLVLSLVAKINDLVEQNKALRARIDELHEPK